jgi:F0F1-type ATP synthase epsilon subunit
MSLRWGGYVGINRKKFLIEKTQGQLAEVEDTIKRYSELIAATREEIADLKQSLGPETTTPADDGSEPTNEENAENNADGSGDEQGDTQTNVEAEAQAPAKSVEETLGQYFSARDPLRLQSVIAALVLHSGERGVDEYLKFVENIPFDIPNAPTVEDTEALILAMDMVTYYESFAQTEGEVSVTGDGQEISRLDAASSGLVIERTNQMVLHLSLQMYNADTLFHKLLPQILARTAIFASTGNEMTEYALVSVGLTHKQAKQLVRLARTSIPIKSATESADEAERQAQEKAAKESIKSKIRELERTLNSHTETFEGAHEKQRFMAADEHHLSILYGSCFDTREKQYVYKMCAFKDARQDSTSLGTYSGFEVINPDPADPNSSQHSFIRVSFKDGDICHALERKPARSLVVDLVCDAIGVDENHQSIDSLEPEHLAKLTDIEEPEACSYTARLLTSIACH